MKKQSKASRLDESLGMRRGKESTKKQSYKSRRDESTGMSKDHMKEYAKYSPQQLKKHMAEEKVLLKAKKRKTAPKKQTRADRLDESLGMRRGKESTKSQSYKSRRDESKGMKKAVKKGRK